MIKILYAHKPEIEYLKKMLQGSFSADFARWTPANEYSDKQLFKIIGSCPKPELLLNAGFAGRLNPRLRIGDTVLVGRLFGKYKGDHSTIELNSIYQTTAKQFALAKNMPVVTLYTSKIQLTRQDMAKKIWSETEADIVDMEAYYLCKAAEEMRIPFVSLKIVSDRADNGAWGDIKKNVHSLSRKLGEFAASFVNLLNDEDLCSNTRL